jgi:hypothetical protein
MSPERRKAWLARAAWLDAMGLPQHCSKTFSTGPAARAWKRFRMAKGYG